MCEHMAIYGYMYPSCPPENMTKYIATTAVSEKFAQQDHMDITARAQFLPLKNTT